MTPPSPLLASLYVALGGGFGSVMRYQIGRLVTHWFGPNLFFPWATFTVNVIGSLLMGLLVGTLARHGHGGEHWRLLLGVGVLGGVTTFSSFSMESILLLRGDSFFYAFANLAGNMLLGLLAVWLGMQAAGRLA